MVVSSRKRSLLLPLAVYAIAGGIAAFFIHHAHYGDRGLEAKQALRTEAVALQAELDRLKTMRVDWDRRVAMLRTEAVDGDLLDERARVVLGLGHRNDVVLLETVEPAAQ